MTTILVLNCGSSSVKFAVLHADNGQESCTGIAQRLGTDQATIDWNHQNKKSSRACPRAGHDQALRTICEILQTLKLTTLLHGIGHRVVHGGNFFSASTAINDDVIARIEQCSVLGPLHNPPNLLGIHIARELFPHLPQVAVFDTAFHQTMPEHAYRYAVPDEWFTKHAIRRYGFHGTSHRFVAARAVALLGLDPQHHAIITAHLGNGCSCTAILNGKSVDTTMGLTPLEGVVMGTRSGSIDPAIVGHMATTLQQPAEKIIDVLNKHSGLLGLSGLSNDMRTLLEARKKGHESAMIAVDIFCYVLAKALASLVVPLGHLDALVFTGGIGEHAAEIRAQVLGYLRFLNITVDDTANTQHGSFHHGRISGDSGPVVLVIPTNEELMIAQDTADIIRKDRTPD